MHRSNDFIASKLSKRLCGIYIFYGLGYIRLVCISMHSHVVGGYLLASFVQCPTTGEACLQAPTSDPTHSKGSASEASSLLSGRIDTGETSVASWLSDCEIIDCDGTAVPLSVLVKNKLIAVSEHYPN